MTASITPTSSTILLPASSSSPKYTANQVSSASPPHTAGSKLNHTSSEQTLGIPAGMSSPPAAAKHWSQKMHESVVSAQVIEQFGAGLFYSKIGGGSDNGQFVYFDSSLKTTTAASTTNDENDQCTHAIPMLSGKLFANEIILEIQGQKISGYTLYDVLSCLKQMANTYDTITFRTVKSASHTSACLQSSSQTWVYLQI